MSNPSDFDPVDPHGASAPRENEIRAITYPDHEPHTISSPTAYPNLKEISFQPIHSIESPPQYSAITFPIPTTYPDLSIVRANLPIAVRPQLEINRLEYRSQTYQVAAESAFRTSEIQKTNLDSQLQVTISENRNLISALELKTRAAAQLETDLLQFTTENKSLQADIKLLKNSNQSKSNQEQTLQAELQQLQLQLTKRNSELQDTSSTVIILQAQITDLQKETQQLEKAHKEILQQNQSIQSELVVSKNEIQLKSSDNSTLEKAHKNLLQQLQTTISDLGNTKLQLIDTNKELKDIQHSHKELLQLFKTTKSELDTTNSFCETIKLKNSTLSEQVSLLTQQSERLQNQLAGENQTTATNYTFGLENDIITLKQSNTQLQITNTNYQKQTTLQENQIEELETRVNKLHQVEQALLIEKNETRTLSLQLISLNTTLTDIQQEHIKLQNIIQGYQDQLDVDLPSISSTEANNVSNQQSPSPTPNVLLNEQPLPDDIDDMANTALDDLITALNRRDDIQAIPLFSGTATDQYISSWLSEADSIATIHKWSAEIKKANLASRLRGPEYTAWKQALKDHFKHPADRDKQIIKLENLQQTPNVPIRNFIDKINALYNAIYNDGRNPQNADPELDSLKNDKLVQILLKGAIKPIRELIFQRLPSSNVTWKQAQEAAIMAESMMFKQLTLEPQTSSTATQQNPNVDLLTVTRMQQQQKKLEELEKRLDNINFLGDKSNTTESSVNYMGDDSRSRTSQRQYLEDQNNVYAQQWQEAIELAKANLIVAQARQKHYYDRNLQECSFEPNDVVLLKILKAQKDTKNEKSNTDNEEPTTTTPTTPERENTAKSSANDPENNENSATAGHQPTIANANDTVKPINGANTEVQQNTENTVENVIQTAPAETNEITPPVVLPEEPQGMVKEEGAGHERILQHLTLP
ncbi:hypothetical protein DAPPUDRAFT_329390 [Daphnia pulex]|uniref:Retrotransposon gag domain-containing protein n=1 Tax=Daphnia pulex TaxID=6669 RepID=E9HGF8_DAPPU|nr:hypothetical protein DAPPUDRAFT_329390 [Daphnia pulex]|eukprot:EFX69147.1 hypothetical protein DAPPUDRAFT_329390 [Daphnia pulex]